MVQLIRSSTSFSQPGPREAELSVELGLFNGDDEDDEEEEEEEEEDG